MPDSLDGSKMPGSENKTSLSTPQAKSPLEEASAEVNPSSNPQAPIEPSAPKPVENVQPADTNKIDGPQTTPAPDTDEFLKSILDDQTGGANEPNVLPPVEAPLPKPVPVPDTPKPIEGESALEEQIDREDLLKSNQPKPEVEPPAQPKIKDEVSGMDGIIANRGQDNSFAKPPLSETGQNSEGQGVSSDFVSSVQQNKPALGKSNKLLYVVVIIAVVAIGGYSVYSITGSKSKTTPSITNSSPVTPSGEAVSTQSPDQRRKNDLYVIQQALFSYYANSGSKYPVALEMVFLNTPGNILETSLVPEYLGSLPADPDTTKNYAYKSADGTKFELTAILDDKSDQEAVLSGDRAILTVTQDSKAPSSAVSATAEAQNTALVESDSASTGDIVSSPTF